LNSPLTTTGIGYQSDKRHEADRRRLTMIEHT